MQAPEPEASTTASRDAEREPFVSPAFAAPADIAWRGPASRRAPDDAEAEALADRDAGILNELARHGEARVAFQGLRRRLDIHQQSLTRALRRLERDGFLTRHDDGYALTEVGFAALADGRAAVDTPHAGPSDILPLVHAILPPDVDADHVADRLAGRWYRGLRWYGQSGGPGETVLTWLTEPGDREVRVRIAGGAVAIDLELGDGNAGTSYGAAQALLGALADLYAPGAHAPGPAFAAVRGFAG